METEEEKAARLAAEEEAKKAAELEVEEPELDKDGKPVAPAQEPWEEEEEVKEQDPDDPSKQVPVGKFVRTKRKLKGQISEGKEEIEKLKKENAELLKFKPAPETKLVRPKADSFDTTDEYEAALDKYNDDKLEEASGRLRLKDQQDQASLKAQTDLTGAVDGHYERAAELIDKSGIKPEVYKAADTTVRKAVEAITPNLGDVIVDQIISILGEGSEKVLYYLGRNAAALNKFQSLLASDKSGMKAAIYLGQEKQRLTNPIKPRSKAPDPATEVKGDETTQGAANRFKKKYDAVSAKNDSQAMYDTKKEARAAGVDVSKW
jgi:hypothetical protein